MTSVHPDFLLRFECGGRKRERRPPPLLLSEIPKPDGNASVRGLCVSKLPEMGEYLVSFVLLGFIVCIMEIVYGVNFGHCQFRLKGAISHLRGKSLPLERTCGVGVFLSLRKQHLIVDHSPWRLGVRLREAQVVLSVLYIVSLA